MSRTATNMKFKLRLFPDNAGYSAEKGYTDINLPSLMSNEDKNIGGSLILDLRKMMTARASQEYKNKQNVRSIKCIFLFIFLLINKKYIL